MNRNAKAVLRSEEDVKIQFAIPMLEALGYKKDCMTFEESIPIQEGKKKKNIFVDIVVYSDRKKDTPLLVAETKAPDEILDRDDREQVISYARLLPKIAPLAVLTNGFTTQVYQTLDKTRIKAIPTRADLLSDLVKAVVSAGVAQSLRDEAKKQLFAVEDVGTFKTLLSHCHNVIRNNEGYEPTIAFDELSKVLFAKMYEEKYTEQSRFTLSTYRDTKERLGVNIVQQIFKEILAIPEYSGLFAAGTRIELQDRTIENIVATFEKYDLTLTRFDVKGEAFEHFLGDTFTGGLGQYFTPRNVVEFIVGALPPKIGERIVDPFCGTGGFLIYAFETVSEKIRLHEFSDDEKAKWRKRLSNESLYGTDWIDRTAQTCKMNMIVHGDGNAGVLKHNGFVDIAGKIEDGLFDKCLTNPPFGATESDPEILNRFCLGQGRKSQERMVLALERCIRLVRPGGMVGTVMIDGVLNNDSYHYVRKFLNTEAELLGVISLNEETFQGYSAAAKTSILLMRRRETAQEFTSRDVFMAVCENSGYAPNGAPQAGNQLPDILFDYKKYTASSDTDFIHKHTRIVRVTDASKRIDAEYYVPTGKTPVSEPAVDVVTGLLAKVGAMQQALISIQETVSGKSKTEQYQWIPLSKIFRLVANKVAVVSSEQYRVLGIRGKAQGLFVKSVKAGSEIKGKSLNRVAENWFVFSRLFAQNGSFAFVDKEFVGGYVSNEFPTFEVIDRQYTVRDILEYVVFYLNSPDVLLTIKTARTGSTKKSRGRFKEAQFLEMTIPLPVNATLLSKTLASVRAIREIQESIRQLAANSGQLPRALQLELPKR